MLCLFSKPEIQNQTANSSCNSKQSTTREPAHSYPFYLLLTLEQKTHNFFSSYWHKEPIYMRREGWLQRIGDTGYKMQEAHCRLLGKKYHKSHRQSWIVIQNINCLKRIAIVSMESSQILSYVWRQKRKSIQFIWVQSLKELAHRLVSYEIFSKE